MIMFMLLLLFCAWGIFIKSTHFLNLRNNMTKISVKLSCKSPNPIRVRMLVSVPHPNLQGFTENIFDMEQNNGLVKYKINTKKMSVSH